MAKGKFDKKTFRTKSGWNISRVDGRSKLGKEIDERVKEIKSGKAKFKKLRP